MDINQQIKERSLRVAVIGLGYVGLPMAVEMAEAGYTVYGIDIHPGKIASLRSKRSYVIDVPDEALQPLIGSSLFPGTDFSVLAQAEVAVICVPTPLDRNNRPDVSYIRSAVDGILPYLCQGTLVILESTTYPGTTEELVSGAIARRKSWMVGQDFYVCYSPERVDPGSTAYQIRNTPKVIGGSTPACLAAGAAFYGSFLERVVPVRSTAVAEAAKLFENTFRSVNIALVNELTPVCEQMGIDIWEVLDAAATKPFGYMPFYPGPGIGGHCIPVDPLYLSWRSEQLGLPVEFIGLADRTHRLMPVRMAGRIGELLRKEGKKLEGARVVVSGIAYKKDVDDIRESPALALFEQLKKLGAEVSYHDPHIPSFELDGQSCHSRPAGPGLWSAADIVVIATDHTAVDYQEMADHAPLIFDTRYATRSCRGGNIVVLGRPPAPEGGTPVGQQ